LESGSARADQWQQPTGLLKGRLLSDDRLAAIRRNATAAPAKNQIAIWHLLESDTGVQSLSLKP
jgi:hypothetical protein